jgi:hypothetical protein
VGVGDVGFDRCNVKDVGILWLCFGDLDVLVL